MNDLATIQRDALRARIEAAERRNAERSLADQARAAAAAAGDYTRAHPLTVIGGALAAGLLIGLATRPGRRVAARAASAVGAAASGAAGRAASGARSLAARGGARLAALIGEAILAYALDLLEEALAGKRAGPERSAAAADAAGPRARKARRKVESAKA
jgi:hypothetical protein